MASNCYGTFLDESGDQIEELAVQLYLKTDFDMWSLLFTCLYGEKRHRLTKAFIWHLKEIEKKA